MKAYIIHNKIFLLYCVSLAFLFIGHMGHCKGNNFLLDIPQQQLLSAAQGVPQITCDFLLAQSYFLFQGADHHL